MSIPEKKKISNAKWDKENMLTIGCKLKRSEAEAFKQYAQAQGKTAHTLLKEYILKCIHSIRTKKQ